MKIKVLELIKKNNKGFSLIELIVTIAILGLISTSIFVFFVTGANTYDRVDTSLNLQEQGQFILANIQEKALDTNVSVTWEDSTSTLVLVEEDSSVTPSTITHAYTVSGNTITYNGVTLGVYLDEGNDPFNVVINTEDETITSIDVSLKLEDRNLTFETSRTIAFRNKIDSN